MSIQTDELRLYGAANRPEDDESAAGGAVDTDCVLSIAQPSSPGQLRARSSDAGDSADVTLTYRDEAGEIQIETKALNGASNVTFDATVERVLKVELDGAPDGDVTIEAASGENDEVVTIPAGKTNAAIMFIDSTSGPLETIRYEKMFWVNENAELSLTNAVIELTQDPSSSIRIGLDAAVDGNTSVEDRLSPPGGVTFVDDAVEVSVPGGALAAGSAIGVWVEMTRGAEAAALKSTFTTQLTGTST